MKTLNVDVVVIGAGTAGLAAYRAAKAAGATVALIEGGPYGTTCARVGCMPSKLLIAAAEAVHAATLAPGFGVHIDGKVRIAGREVMARVKAERDRFVGFVLRDVEKIPEADRIRGHARFENDNTLVVDDHTRVVRLPLQIPSLLPSVCIGLTEGDLVSESGQRPQKAFDQILPRQPGARRSSGSHGQSPAPRAAPPRW